MGDSTSEQRPGRRGRPRSPGSSVLTPPTGLPEIPELNLPAWPDSPPAAPPVVPTPRTATDPCACGHGKDAHDHYRPGTDCGACGADVCDEFRPEGGGIRKTLRRWGLVG